MPNWNWRSWMRVVWPLSVLLALAVRIPGLSDQAYYWRELQTEMTSFWFQKEGIDLIHSQTPIYGPPWQVPFEFPLYQAASALVERAGFGDIEFASRVTALLCFGLSAFFLYLLCKDVFGNSGTTFLIVSLYLWIPYNIYYSDVPQIDYLSVAFALAYLYFVLRWLKSSSKPWLAFAATLAGSLAMLVKPTTVPIALVPIATFVLRDLLLRYKEDLAALPNAAPLAAHLWRDRYYCVFVLIMLMVPVAIGYGWTRHADQIKASSLFTRWLTSYNQRAWTLGTLELRANPDVWIDHTNTAIRFLWPYGLSLLAGLGVAGAWGIARGPKQTQETVLFISSIAGGIVLTFAIFLNLYLHEYYYIALSASMAILGGFGAAWFWRLRPILGHAHLYAFAIFAVIFLYGNTRDFLLFRSLAAARNAERTATVGWIRQVWGYLPHDKWVVVVESDWDPTVPYLLERKSMVVTKRETDKPLCGILSDPHFALVVILDQQDSENRGNLSRVLLCFRSDVEVMPGVYQVAH